MKTETGTLTRMAAFITNRAGTLAAENIGKNRAELEAAFKNAISDGMSYVVNEINLHNEEPIKL